MPGFQTYGKRISTEMHQSCCCLNNYSIPLAALLLVTTHMCALAPTSSAGMWVSTSCVPPASLWTPCWTATLRPASCTCAASSAERPSRCRQSRAASWPASLAASRAHKGQACGALLPPSTHELRRMLARVVAAGLAAAAAAAG